MEPVLRGDSADHVAALSRYFGGVPRATRPQADEVKPRVSRRQRPTSSARPGGGDADAVRRAARRSRRRLRRAPCTRVRPARRERPCLPRLHRERALSRASRDRARGGAAALGAREPALREPAVAREHALVHAARERVLRFFDADPDEYVVCFTANTTGAIHLVASGFAFGPDAPFILAADDHNSVNGVRAYAERAGARVHYLPLDDELRLHDPVSRLAVLRRTHVGAGLVAFPAQSNFSGVQHPLALVDRARALGYTRPARRGGVRPDVAAEPAANPRRLRGLLLLQDVRLPDRRRRTDRAPRGAGAAAPARGSPAARWSTRRCSTARICCARAPRDSRTAP